MELLYFLVSEKSASKFHTSNIATSIACTSFLQTESDGFAWINESICKFGNKLIYDRVQAEDGILKIGDFVYYEDQICQIIYFFEIR